MTYCTTCVTVVAFLLQLLSHVLPNSELKDAGLGWWQLGSNNDKDDAWLVPMLHTIALFSDLTALRMWCEYSGDDCCESRDRRSAEEAKEFSRFCGAISAVMKFCGCCGRVLYPKPGMVWCCVASAASLLFTLISTCSSATEEYDPREKHRKDQNYLV